MMMRASSASCSDGRQEGLEAALTPVWFLLRELFGEAPMAGSEIAAPTT